MVGPWLTFPWQVVFPSDGAAACVLVLPARSLPRLYAILRAFVLVVSPLRDCCRLLSSTPTPAASVQRYFFLFGDATTRFSFSRMTYFFVPPGLFPRACPTWRVSAPPSRPQPCGTDLKDRFVLIVQLASRCIRLFAALRPLLGFALLPFSSHRDATTRCPKPASRSLPLAGLFVCLGALRLIFPAPILPASASSHVYPTKTVFTPLSRQQPPGAGPKDYFVCVTLTRKCSRSSVPKIVALPSWISRRDPSILLSPLRVVKATMTRRLRQSSLRWLTLTSTKVRPPA